MARPRVWLATLGGTAGMTNAIGRGLVPTLGAAELLSAVPGLADVADVEACSLPSRPGASLGFADVAQAAAAAESAVAAGAAGAVLVQGTDTLEETAYLLDLLWAHDGPIVLTGAMRAPGQPGADGTANLLAAVTVAACPDARRMGAIVVLADEMHAARRVAKTDTVAAAAFRSVPFGPIGRMVEGRVTVANWPARAPVLPRPVDLTVRVGLLEVTLGDRGLAMLAGVEPAGLSGLVVAGAGAGHVPAGAVDALTTLAERMPVVLASRVGGGPVLERTYAFPGSEQDLLGRGLISAGWLAARKARLLLWALLAARLPRSAVVQQFAARAALP